jgi:hypothetical protein
MHYTRWLRHGDPKLILEPKRPPRLRMCGVEGCDRKHRRWGYCDMHYLRVRRHGNPETRLTPWKGDDAGYAAVHIRVRKQWGPAREHSCLHCGEAARQWALNHDTPADRLRTEVIHGGREVVFSPDPSAYIALCVPCHKRYDLERAASDREREPSYAATAA